MGGIILFLKYRSTDLGRLLKAALGNVLPHLRMGIES
jgi:hypothetical protein